MSRCTKKNCPMVGVSADCDLKDCPYRTEADQSKDTIYREDAIKAVKRISENYTGKGKRDYHPHIDFIIDELKYCVPSADRPQGEWIRMTFTDCGSPIDKCSNCGHYINGDVEVRNFCPNCGAEMRGKDDE